MASQGVKVSPHNQEHTVLKPLHRFNPDKHKLFQLDILPISKMLRDFLEILLLECQVSIDPLFQLIE